jgi:hypothetical protein
MMKLFQIDLGKFSVLVIFFFFYNCVSIGEYESLKKEKERKEETSYLRLSEYREKIKLLTEELEQLKEECQPTAGAIKRKPKTIEDEKLRKIKRKPKTIEDEKLRKIRELKKKNDKWKS